MSSNWNKMTASELTTTPLERLSAALQEGLHAAAQPLTMIQVALSRECTAMLTEAELRDLTETSARESNRAARLFRILLQLLESFRATPALRGTDLSKVVSRCVSTQLEQEPGFTSLLVSHEDGGLPAVTADEQATAELIRILLESIRASIGPGEVILVSCERSGSGVQVSVSSENSLLHRQAELRIALLLATAVMERQGGTASCRTSPFSLNLLFNIFPKEKSTHEQ